VADYISNENIKEQRNIIYCCKTLDNGGISLRAELNNEKN
tara:strand:- start:214 stop:333 length:120 start_codon:yes stop_codon:yes gene_type:complete